MASPVDTTFVNARAADAAAPAVRGGESSRLPAPRPVSTPPR
jgi:hypothetical protein